MSLDLLSKTHCTCDILLSYPYGRESKKTKPVEILYFGLPIVPTLSLIQINTFLFFSFTILSLSLQRFLFAAISENPRSKFFTVSPSISLRSSHTLRHSAVLRYPPLPVLVTVASSYGGRSHPLSGRQPIRGTVLRLNFSHQVKTW